MAKKTSRGIFASAALIACMALPGLAFASNESATIEDELNPVNAQIESVNLSFESSSLPDSVKVSVKNKITGDGIDYKLYPTFDDKSKAIEEVGKKCADRLSILSSSYLLPPLDESNWETYFDCMMKFYDDIRCPDWYQESDQEESTLQYFFSIMQNDGLNQQIIDTLDNAKVECANLEAESDEAEEVSEEVTALLPDQEMLEESLEDDDAEQSIEKENSISTHSAKASKLTKLKSFNKTKGTNYAKQYVDYPNTGKYGYYSGKDCANFASQIIEAGGVKQTKKWWHKNTNGKQTQSAAWSTADSFANYFGIGYKTHNAKSFSTHLKAGDFIGTSWAKDGKWNHIGYVTAVKAQKNGKCEYQVAQHSKNYLAWTSSKINDWENQGGSDKYLGRIGR